MSRQSTRQRVVGMRPPRTQLLALLVLVVLLRIGESFQPSLKAPNPSFSEALKKSLRMPVSSGGVSSGLISQLAVVALKVRLAGHTDVSCDVKSKSSDLLLNGRVGPVTVKGKGWQSGRGLTCRAIEATVDTCELDVGRVLSRRKLSLINPALGKAMVALDGIDFGNFITHPLMKPPIMAASASSISFVREGAIIDPTTGAVTFFAEYEGQRWECILKRGDSPQKRAIISVTPAEDTTLQNAHTVSTEMASSLSRFFNEMVFELDGTFLTFRDMMVTDRGQSPNVLLALNIKVHKFPSAGLDF